MINVKIDETTLLNLFMDRLEYWTSDDDVLALYKSYLERSIDWNIDGVLDINLREVLE